MEPDKYHAMAVIAAEAGGLRDDQVGGLAHIFRQIVSDERKLISDYLSERAKFWDAYPNHSYVSRALRHEAFVIQKGVPHLKCNEPRSRALMESTLPPPGDEKG